MNLFNVNVCTLMAVLECLEGCESDAKMKASPLCLATELVIAEFNCDRSCDKVSFAERELREAEMKLRDAGFVALEVVASISAAYVAAKVALVLGLDTNWAAAISAFVFTVTIFTIGRHLGFFFRWS
jgi:hypothetical protein